MTVYRQSYRSLCSDEKSFLTKIKSILLLSFLAVKNSGRIEVFLRGCSYGGELARLGGLARLVEISPS